MPQKMAEVFDNVRSSWVDGRFCLNFVVLRSSPCLLDPVKQPIRADVNGTPLPMGCWTRGLIPLDQEDRMDKLSIRSVSCDGNGYSVFKTAIYRWSCEPSPVDRRRRADNLEVKEKFFKTARFDVFRVFKPTFGVNFRSAAPDRSWADGGLGTLFPLEIEAFEQTACRRIPRLPTPLAHRASTACLSASQQSEVETSSLFLRAGPKSTDDVFLRLACPGTGLAFFGGRRPESREQARQGNEEVTG